MAVDAALEVPWRAYRTWAATSRYLRDDIDRWRSRTLILAILGAILAALGQQVTAIAPKIELWAAVAKASELIAALAIALSAYFAREALAGKRIGDWVKARAAAESLVANLFLYRAKAPPFDADQSESELFRRVVEIEQTVSEIQTRPGIAEAEIPELSPLSADDYIKERVNGQLEYYDTRANEYQRKSDRLRNATLWLGAASLMLGIISASSSVAPWVGVIATVTAALSAHAQSARYQTLTAAYQSTSRRLGLLVGEWAASKRTDADTSERNAFIRHCEDVMAIENSAWLGPWSQKEPTRDIDGTSKT